MATHFNNFRNRLKQERKKMINKKKTLIDKKIDFRRILNVATYPLVHHERVSTRGKHSDLHVSVILSKWVVAG